MKTPSLSRLLRKTQKAPPDKLKQEARIEKLQLEMLRVQQGIYHGKGRAIVIFEGFDAAGKGGCIRTLTSLLDPRGVAVHPVGPPNPEERGRHWLYRFWRDLPLPSTIAVFDRSWYGRVLVEKVEALTKPGRIHDAYREINEFERMLADDGITLIKFFLGISRDEQLRRFEDRLNDPYKQWKLSEDDLRNRRNWNAYVKAVDKMFRETHSKHAPWRLVPSDHKSAAREAVLSQTVEDLGDWGDWIQNCAAKLGRRTLKQEMKALGAKDLR
ncbi:MAG: polyphosphate kinase 2 family protein [Bdellovibrionota bacterium]